MIGEQHCDPGAAFETCGTDPGVPGTNIVPGSNGGTNTSVMPEPSALITSGTGLLALCVYVRRQRR